MVKKTIEIYIAEDGREFNNKEDCIKHEKELLYINGLKKALLEVKKICGAYACCNCPLADNEKCPASFKYSDWDEVYEPYNWRI